MKRIIAITWILMVSIRGATLILQDRLGPGMLYLIFSLLLCWALTRID